MSQRKMHRLAGALLAVLSLTVLSTASNATSVQQMSVVDLLNHSQDIVAGKVDKVSDGFDAKGVPYTEVTLKVTDMIRGANRIFGAEAVLYSESAGWKSWFRRV